MNKSKIEWTETTWNPITGCTKISSGCLNCYAERMAKRLHAMGHKNYSSGFKLTCHPHTLNVPINIKKPNMIFVNSMSDLFHKDVPVEFIKKIFAVMRIADQHTYQVLTKRAKRLFSLSKKLKWNENIWMGVTVEDSNTKDRIDYLRACEAHIKFLSCEPLIGDLGELNLEGIDWVIAGGESGPRARPINPDWVRSIRNQCIEQNVPFFFKQWGGVRKKENGRLLDGRIWDQMPKEQLVHC